MKKSVLSLLILILIFSLLSFSRSESSAKVQETVYLIPVKGTIDLGLSAFIKRSVAEAKKEKIRAVIFEIDTFGGRVDAATEIVSAIQEISPLPTYAYITDSAWSAGALIAFACKNIVMKPGASIGSAEPRTQIFSDNGQQITDEKIVSALRAKFKATAEANKHSVNLAQAMVDKDIELIKVEINNETVILTRQELDKKKTEFNNQALKNEEIINPKGKLLNLTALEAKQLKLAAEIVNSEAELLKFTGLENCALKTTTATWSENLVRFITEPLVSSLLLSLGFLLLLIELKLPHWGITGTIGVIFIVLFFWGHYLVGLADWIDILIFAIGLIFLLIELFFIPGFGLIGILGIIFILCGLFFTFIKHPLSATPQELYNAFYVIAYAFIFSFIFLITAIKFIPRTPLWRRLRLRLCEKKELGFTTNIFTDKNLLGKIGKAETLLRPVGRARFNGETLEVTTFGEYIPQGEKVKIVKVENNKIFVAKI